MHPLANRFLATLAALLLGLTFSGRANALMIDFEGLSSLSDLASMGVAFSSNVSLWEGGSDSVLANPDGGPVSPTHGICAGNCGAATGSIFFDSPQGEVALWALSGPGPDLINAGTQIEAFDLNGASLGVAVAATDVQFQQLMVQAPGIRRVDFSSPVPVNEAFDNFSFSAIPEPSTVLLVAAGLAALAASRRRNAQ